VAHPVTKGPILAIAGDRAVNNSGIHFSDAFIVNAEPIDHSGSKAFQHNVGLFNQPQKDLFAFFAFQIQRHVFFVAVNRIDEQAVGYKLSAFNGDHPRPMVRQDHGAIRPRQQAGEVNHSNIRKGTFFYHFLYFPNYFIRLIGKTDSITFLMSGLSGL